MVHPIAMHSSPKLITSPSAKELLSPTPTSISDSPCSTGPTRPLTAAGTTTMATVELPPPITPRISSPTLTSSPESPLKSAPYIVQPPGSVFLALALVTVLVTFRANAAEDFLPEEKAYYLCAGCHGPAAGSVLYPMPHDIPTIIGQRKDYLLKQLISYREGHRKHPNMSDVLTNYTDQNLADLAEYYESLGPKRPGRVSRTPPTLPAHIHTEAKPPSAPLKAHSPHKRTKRVKPAPATHGGVNNSH